jgi:Ca-activated chloride channel homolog
MSFGQPLLLLALLVVPAAIAAYVLAQRRRARYVVRFTNLEVLAGVIEGRPWRRHVPALIFLAALVALCLGLARPHAVRQVVSRNSTVILVVDTSGSMQADDVKPTRLGAAQQAVRLFLKRVPGRMRVGLISFAGEPQVGAPPTRDHDLVRRAVDELGGFENFTFGGGGTAIGDAIAAAVELAQVRQAPDGGNETIAYRQRTPAASTPSSVSILFLSDGSQTRGFLQPLEGAARAKAAGIPIYTVALGTPNGVIVPPFGPFGRTEPIPVPPDPATLSAIARTTGGQFFAARTAKTLESAYKRLGSRLGRTRGRTEVTYAFLAGAAALLLGAGLLSARWSARLP